jgi:hypothetical protein
MAGYRLYTVDREGKFTGAKSLHARTDQEAVILAKVLNEGNDCEIWDSSRFVQFVPSQGGRTDPGIPS